MAANPSVLYYYLIKKDVAEGAVSYQIAPAERPTPEALSLAIMRPDNPNQALLQWDRKNDAYTLNLRQKEFMVPDPKYRGFSLVCSENPPPEDASVRIRCVQMPSQSKEDRTEIVTELELEVDRVLYCVPLSNGQYTLLPADPLPTEPQDMRKNTVYVHLQSGDYVVRLHGGKPLIGQVNRDLFCPQDKCHAYSVDSMPPDKELKPDFTYFEKSSAHCKIRLKNGDIHSIKLDAKLEWSAQGKIIAEHRKKLETDQNILHSMIDFLLEAELLPRRGMLLGRELADPTTDRGMQTLLQTRFARSDLRNAEKHAAMRAIYPSAVWTDAREVDTPSGIPPSDMCIVFDDNPQSDSYGDLITIPITLAQQEICFGPFLPEMEQVLLHGNKIIDLGVVEQGQPKMALGKDLITHITRQAASFHQDAGTEAVRYLQKFLKNRLYVPDFTPTEKNHEQRCFTLGAKASMDSPTDPILCSKITLNYDSLALSKEDSAIVFELYAPAKKVLGLPNAQGECKFCYRFDEIIFCCRKSEEQTFMKKISLNYERLNSVSELILSTILESIPELNLSLIESLALRFQACIHFLDRLIDYEILFFLQKNPNGHKEIGKLKIFLTEISKRLSTIVLFDERKIIHFSIIDDLTSILVEIKKLNAVTQNNLADILEKQVIEPLETELRRCFLNFESAEGFKIGLSNLLNLLKNTFKEVNFDALEAAIQHHHKENMINLELIAQLNIFLKSIPHSKIKEFLSRILNQLEEHYKFQLTPVLDFNSEESLTRNLKAIANLIRNLLAEKLTDAKALSLLAQFEQIALEPRDEGSVLKKSLMDVLIDFTTALPNENIGILIQTILENLSLQRDSDIKLAAQKGLHQSGEKWVKDLLDALEKLDGQLLTAEKEMMLKNKGKIFNRDNGIQKRREKNGLKENSIKDQIQSLRSFCDTNLVDILHGDEEGLEKLRVLTTDILHTIRFLAKHEPSIESMAGGIFFPDLFFQNSINSDCKLIEAKLKTAPQLGTLPKNEDEKAPMVSPPHSSPTVGSRFSRYSSFPAPPPPSQSSGDPRRNSVSGSSASYRSVSGLGKRHGSE